VITKQQYLPSSNLLQTRHLNEEGVLNVIDFFPRLLTLEGHGVSEQCNKWLVRRVECVRGKVDVHVEVQPGFNYAMDEHEVHVESLEAGRSGSQNLARFDSKDLSLELLAVEARSKNEDGKQSPVSFTTFNNKHAKGPGVRSCFSLEEGQSVTFILRDVTDENDEAPNLTCATLYSLQKETERYWYDWVSQSKYTGRWREVVQRSLLLLKLMTYEPTGAIVASPTFSVPEHFGGSRNWDYRFSWVRDSSFTIYILLRMGFKDEAAAYMGFITSRLQDSRLENGGLPIMFSIHGKSDLDELELEHLEGYRKSAPVRIGNGAATHKQLDIYGELMDAIYLYNKYGAPISYDMWVSIKSLIAYVIGAWKEPDMSIWEVRGTPQNFVYSKIMMWVAVDRALRLSEKREFPCRERYEWMNVRDEMYEDIMDRGFNKEMGCFVQSYESREMLDSAVLIAPLVFFIAPNDPRFTNTLEKILQPPEKGGLTSAGLVYRYNWLKSDDGT
jgi:GH15 family glucan-1,4-alpha-glucosidase